MYQVELLLRKTTMSALPSPSKSVERDRSFPSGGSAYTLGSMMTGMSDPIPQFTVKAPALEREMLQSPVEPKTAISALPSPS